MYKLISVNSNPKLEKGNKLQETYWNVVMHLSPINTKICPYQDIAGCKTACLNTSGRGGIFKRVRQLTLFKMHESVRQIYILTTETLSWLL